jgi:probable HAF family extracellular repeat protein
LVVVGQSVSLNGWEAFRWTNLGGMVGLGDLPGGIFSSSAYAASADGSVVVGLSASGPSAEAFRWSEADGMVGLGHLAGQDYSVANGVSADGSVVVGDSHGPATYSAFVWTAADGMRALKDLLVDAGVDLTGWRLDYASAVSADGTTIAGSGRNPNGDTEAWFATLPLPP